MPSAELIHAWHFADDQSLLDRVGGVTLTNAGRTSVFHATKGVEVTSSDEISGVITASAAEGIMYIETYTANNASIGVLTAWNSGSGNANSLEFWLLATSEAPRGIITSSFATQFSQDGSGITDDNATRSRFGYYWRDGGAGDTARLSQDGTFPTTADTSLTAPTGLTNLDIGHRNGTFFCNGHVEKFYIYNSINPGGTNEDTFLDNLTSGAFVEDFDVGVAGGGVTGGTGGSSSSILSPLRRRGRRRFR